MCFIHSSVLLERPITASASIFFLRHYSPKSGLGRLVLRFLNYILSRVPLNERWARHRGRYLHNTQDTNIHLLSGIRAPGPSIEEGAEHIPPKGHTATRIRWPPFICSYSLITLFLQIIWRPFHGLCVQSWPTHGDPSHKYVGSAHKLHGKVEIYWYQKRLIA